MVSPETEFTMDYKRTHKQQTEGDDLSFGVLLSLNNSEEVKMEGSGLYREQCIIHYLYIGLLVCFMGERLV